MSPCLTDRSVSTYTMHRRWFEQRLYDSAIPGAFIVPEWDLMYFVEAVDTSGNGLIVPDLDQETPHVIVPVQR